MDTLILHDCRFKATIGVTEEERATPQAIGIDVEMGYETNPSSKTDNIEDTINYSEVHREIKSVVESKERKLIERLAEELADTILKKFSVKTVTLTIKKLDVMKSKDVAYSAVRITRP